MIQSPQPSMLKFSPRIKKGFLVLFILSICSVIYIVYSLNSSKKPVSKTSNNPPKITSSTSDISSLTTPKISLDPNVTLPQNLPPSLPVYQVTPTSQLDVYPLAEQLAAEYKLKLSDFSKNYWVSPDNSVSFYFDPVNKSVNYSVNSDTLPNYYTGNFPPTTQSAITAAQIFIKSNPLFSDYTLQQSQIAFYLIHPGDQEYESTTNQNQANLISIPFTQTFHEYPYRLGSALIAPLVVTIGQQNRVIKFIYTPQSLPQTISFTDHNTLTVTEISESLSSGIASVVYAPLYNIPPKTKDLPPITVTDIKIEYHFDSNTSTISPFFLIAGHFSAPNSKSQVTYPVLLLLPAVKY